MLVYDILYKKNKYQIKALHIFLTSGISTRKTFMLMCIIQNMFQFYIEKP
jgi:hypothetical protein